MLVVADKFNDAQVMVAPAQLLNEMVALNLGTDYDTHWAGVPDDGVYLAPSLLHPKSVGTVEIKSADPLTHPTIQAAYLTDPYDLAAMVEICKTTMKMTETEAWKAVIGKQYLLRGIYMLHNSFNLPLFIYQICSME